MSDDGADGDNRDDGGDVSRGGTPAPLSVGSGATLGGRGSGQRSECDFLILLANTARGSTGSAVLATRCRATHKHDESLVV